uniref:Reverse transcriptase Ty1/copia-type domain-containing protein n=1 Tax=Micrurus surinamensis TaxID=129470 RepID=A0A2D4PCN3_MICSU
MFLNGCPVYWQVRKQNFISCSSTEAEYACVSDACNSLTWFDALITDIWMNLIPPITIMEDNESVVYISDNHFTGSRSRHIDIRYKNIKQLVKQGFIKLQYVSTHEQIADLLNKPLPTSQHEYLRQKICLI